MILWPRLKCHQLFPLQVLSRLNMGSGVWVTNPLVGHLVGCLAEPQAGFNIFEATFWLIIFLVGNNGLSLP